MKMQTTMQVVADTFRTLSGAPKHRAMQLIEEYEKTNHTFLCYGGAIGFIWTLKEILIMLL
jgi:anthranilate synthase component 1